jgi:hypothetical protein
MKELMKQRTDRKFREVCEGILEAMASNNPTGRNAQKAKKVWTVLFDSSNVQKFTDEEVKEAKEFMDSAYISYIVNRHEGAPNEEFYQWFAKKKKEMAERGNVNEYSIYSKVSA